MDINQVLSIHRKTLAIADHGSYHSYLTRRILTLRRKLGIATTKSQKFVHHEVTSDDVVKDARYLELLVLQAERAWARAMHLKSLRGEGEGGLKGRDRSEVISKCAKAARLAERIVVLVQQSSGSNDQAVLESRAYQAMLKGTELFEKLASGSTRRSSQDWEQCLQEWSTARVCYSALADKGSELSSDLVSSTIDPTLRYAAYQAGIPRTVSMQDVARKYCNKSQDLKSTLEAVDPYALTGRPRAYGEKAAKGEVPATIAWRGRNANLVDASIGQAVAGVNTAEAKLRTFLTQNASLSTREKAVAYDEILIASQDAADATKRAADELEKEKVEESDSRMQNLRITSLATTYSLISWRVGRNRALIGVDDGLTLPKRQINRPATDKVKPESVSQRLASLKERVVLLDAILQSIESVKDLRGAMRDEAFVRELDGKLAYFRALKCVNIAYSHSLCEKPLNALALFTRAHELIASSTITGPAAVRDSTLTLELDAATIEGARSTIATLQAHSHAKATMRQMEQNSALAEAKHLTSAEPLINRLTDYPTPGIEVDLARLVSYPPKLEPVPMKPIFLDIAWNYIDYPGRQLAVPVSNGIDEPEPESKQEDKKRGWFGFGR